MNEKTLAEQNEKTLAEQNEKTLAEQAVSAIIAAYSATEKRHGAVAALIRDMIKGFTALDGTSLADLTSARLSAAGKTPVGNVRADGSRKTAFDELRSRLTKEANAQGYLLRLTWDKSAERYTSAVLQKVEAPLAVNAPIQSIVDAAPLAVSDAAQRILALCAENALSVSEVLIAAVNISGSGTLAAIAAHLHTPLAPLAAADTLPIVGLSQDAIEASVNGAKPRQSRRANAK